MDCPVVKLWQRLQVLKTSDSVQVDNGLLAFVSSTNLVSKLKNTAPNFKQSTSWQEFSACHMKMLINFNA